MDCISAQQNAPVVRDTVQLLFLFLSSFRPEKNIQNQFKYFVFIFFVLASTLSVLKPEHCRRRSVCSDKPGETAPRPSLPPPSFLFCAFSEVHGGDHASWHLSVKSDSKYQSRVSVAMTPTQVFTRWNQTSV